MSVSTEAISCFIGRGDCHSSATLRLAMTYNTMPHTPILTIRNLSAVFPDDNGGLRALDDVTFDVHPREFVCVLGPSGSGKTTLLRILAGLISPTSGSFMFGHGEQPSTGMVFQQANLMPWRTVIENIKLPLEVQQIDEASAWRKAQEMIELVGLQGFEELAAARTLRRDGAARGHRARPHP